MQSPNEWVQQAETLIAEGRLDKAVDAYDNALTQDDKHLPALKGAAHLALQLELPEEAGQFIDRALTLDDQDSEAQTLKALLLEGTEGLEAALEVYAANASQHRESFPARFHYGRALTAAGQAKEALPELQAAVRLSPGHVGSHYTLGYAYFRAGKPGEAVEVLSQLIEEIDPAFLDGYITLAEIFASTDRLSLARDILAQAQKALPHEPLVLDKLAGVCVQDGDLSGAIAALSQLVALAPEEQAYANLISFAMAGDELQVAATAAEQMLELHPDSWQAHHFIATFLDLGGYPEKAVEELRTAHQLAPQEWKPLNDLGDLLNAKAQTEPEVAHEAVDVLTQACLLAPPQALAPRYNLALAYWNANHKERAREAMALLVENGPQDNDITQQATEILAAMTQALEQNKAQ